MLASEAVVEDANGFRFAVPNMAEPIAFHLLVNGVYEPDTQSFILQRLSTGDVFVDVGANIGLFTVGAASKVGKRGRVIAIEPSPRIFSYLEKNILTNMAINADALNVAASDQNRTEVPFYAAPSDHFGMGALAPQFHQEPCLVETRTLDSILTAYRIQHVAVLKVDVEGHEAGVFRGAKDLLQRTPAPVIIFEFCDWAEARFPGGYPGQAQQFLMNLGYRIHRLLPHARLGPWLAAPMTKGSAMLVAARARVRI
jgi:FkbM family methyltransferase